ncbi:DNA methyltransferase [uncultured Ilyobacter sp.]|uniref:site-specific DNA-methyltransferase n=1 Tax=uncultured Ilyobacter sp. TaxID=544433 RepID=UPI002AA64E86|nr:DNA methyltransferase [uncultured Ilyobacter sp.]
MSDLKDNHKIDILKKEFPECFDRDGNFNLEKFQGIISPETKVFKDSYGLNWLGKSYARALAQGEAKKMLREDVKHNSKEENRDSENLYIKGDNLEVLKHLDNGYREKIKMIYIDPPYNTKSGEFVYNDNRDFSEKELDKLVKINIIDEEEKERILKWEGNSSSHSAWLTFMFPRLYLSRKLLAEDGVIFISIDDNEVAQLRLICDEIFGEDNFVTQISWQRAYAPVNMNKHFSQNHDHILVYAKNLELYKLFKLPRSDKQNKDYKNLDNDPRGNWKSGNPSVGPANPKNIYEVTLPSGRKVLPPKGRSWLYSEDKLKEMIKENRIWFGKDGNSVWAPKMFLKEVSQGVTPLTVWTYSEVGHSQDAKKELKKLFDNNSLFDYPKPVSLLKRMLILSSSEEDVILDFFSGSATTAHAVNKLNLEDGGNRKWIMVQLEEELPQKSEAYKFCEKEGLPKNITSIGIERIKRANRQMLDEEETKNQENFDRIELEKKLGFKIFGIDNKIKELDEMIEFTDEITLPEPISFTNNDRLDLVHTYKLQDGNFLNAEIEKIKLSWEKTVVGGEGSGTYIYEGFRVGEILYLIDSIASSEVQSKIIEKIDNDPEFKINKIVIYGFTNTIGKYRVELEENIKNYNNKKGANIEVEVRY